MLLKIFIGLLAALFSTHDVVALTIISKAEWVGAPSTTTLANGLSYAVIHHTAGHNCSTKALCIQQMRNIQNNHQKTLGWDDIGYNFLIGGDGNVYEGRGWNVKGAHAASWNPKSLGISFMGNYNNDVPTAGQISAAKNLLTAAVARGKLVSNYTLYGHQQVGTTECPGNNLWNEIKTWANWKA